MKPITSDTLLPWKNKNLTDMDGEQWRPVPGIEGYATISNFGRVKRLAYEIVDITGKCQFYPERIQSQKLTLYFNQFLKEKAGHLNTRIQIEKVCYSLSIGRIVYYCFVEKFDLKDRSIYISYKDFNRLNTTPENLFKTDLSGLLRHSINAGRKDLHFGHSAENQLLFVELGKKVNRKKVHQYDMEGNYVYTYESISAAAEQMGLDISAISAVVRGKTYTSGGYIWRLGQKKLTISVKKIHVAIRATKGDFVSSYDLEGKKVETYYNIGTAARALELPRRTLSDAVNGKIIVYGGFVWRKGDEAYINVEKEKKSQDLRKGYTLSQYTPDGKKVRTFHSGKEASKYAGVPVERISAMSIRDDLLLNGFIWRYGAEPFLDEEEIAKIEKNLTQEKKKDISQYKLNGRRLAHFVSITDAAKATGVSMSSIQSSADGRKVTGGGFIWRRGKGKIKIIIPVTPRVIGSKLQKGVQQFDRKGKFINSYVSISEASRQTGVHISAISSALKGVISTAGGYTWETL